MSTNITPGLYKCQIQIVDDDSNKTYPIIYTIDCMCIENESFDCISYDFFGAVIQPSSGHTAPSIGFKEKKNNSNTTPRNGYIKVFNPKYASNDYFVQIDYFGAISSINRSLIYQISDTANVKDKGFTATNLKNKNTNHNALCGSVFIINGLIYKNSFKLINNPTPALSDNEILNKINNAKGLDYQLTITDGFYLCKLKLMNSNQYYSINCICFVNKSVDCISYRLYGALIAYKYDNIKLLGVCKYKIYDGILELYINNEWVDIRIDSFYGLLNSPNVTGCLLQYSNTDIIKILGSTGTFLYKDGDYHYNSYLFDGCSTIIGGMTIKTSGIVSFEENNDERFAADKLSTINTIGMPGIYKARLFVIDDNESYNKALAYIDCYVLETTTYNNTTKLNVYTFFGADVALQCNSNNNWVELLNNDTTIIKDKISKKLYGAWRPTFGMQIKNNTNNNQGNGYFKIYNEKYKSTDYVVQFDYIYAHEFYDRQYASQLAGYAPGGTGNYRVGLFACNNNTNQEQFRGIMPIFAAYKVVSS